MSVFFEIAKFPQRIKTIHSFFSDKRWITVSVNCSQPFHPCDAGLASRTVRTAFRRSIPCSAQSVRSVCSLCIQVSLSNSLKIFLRLGWGLLPVGTENDKPIAAQTGCPAPSLRGESLSQCDSTWQSRFPKLLDRFVPRDDEISA